MGLSGERATIVLFGDSITQHGFEDGGWAASVADYFSRRADVFNRGFGGYNTRWANYLLPTLFPEGDKHLLVTVWFGANDAAAPGENPHVPLDEFGRNLRSMLEHLKRTADHVVVLTPPPVHGPTRLDFQRRKFGSGATGVLERNTETAGQYAAEAVRVARELEVPVLDVHRLMLAEPDWSKFVGGPGAGAVGDGLHLSAEGQRFVGSRLVAFLKETMHLPIPPTATPQARLVVDVPGLPIELPPGARMDPNDFVGCIREHRARRARQMR